MVDTREWERSGGKRRFDEVRKMKGTSNLTSEFCCV